VPLAVVRRQIEVVAADLAPAAVKTGMLATAELVGGVAAAIRELGLPNFVVDPVMVATSGDRLLDEDALAAVTGAVCCRCAAVVTPNLDEARLLTGEAIEAEADMLRVAERLVESGAGAALVKGGHLEGREVVDVLVDAEGTRSWRRSEGEDDEHPRDGVHAVGGHRRRAGPRSAAAGGGGGCAGLRAHRAIGGAPGLGHGNGPLNHFVGASG
jgi:hydroxymethylpyrimidine/phosphomethylpyrimidine kinase